MRRATVTIPGDLEEALDSYVRRQEVTPTLTALMQTALREYLARRGSASPQRTLRITPAKRGSGKPDVSRRHDRYFAENG
jgi:hypothetical protein